MVAIDTRDEVTRLETEKASAQAVQATVQQRVEQQLKGVGQELQTIVDKAANSSAAIASRYQGITFTADEKCNLVDSTVDAVVDQIGSNLPDAVKRALKERISSDIKYTAAATMGRQERQAADQQREFVQEAEELKSPRNGQSLKQPIYRTNSATAALFGSQGTDQDEPLSPQKLAQPLRQGNTIGNSQSELVQDKQALPIGLGVDQILEKIRGEITAAVAYSLKETPELNITKAALAPLKAAQGILVENSVPELAQKDEAKIQRTNAAEPGGHYESLERASRGSFRAHLNGLN